MTTHRAIACALALSIAATSSVWGAEKKKKTVKKAVGRTETLACRLGTEDRHARIAVVVIKGKTDSFAYYSKWKPRTCSIYLERNRDPYSKWADTGDVTTISLEKGAFLIEHKPGEYHFIFRDVDRERFCGMDGVINGTLTIKRGKDQCVLGGEIMAEGTPLGHVPAAYAGIEGGAAASATPSEAATPVKEQTAGTQPAKNTAAAEDAPAKANTAAAEPVKERTAATEAAEKKSAAAEAAPAKATTAAAEPETKTETEQTAAVEPAEQKSAKAEADSESAKTAKVESTSEESAKSKRPKVDAADAGPADTTTTAAAESAADAPTPNPLRAFFRALAPTSREKEAPFPN